MSTITLPNIRVGSDLQIRVRLTDGGVAIDWSTLSNVKAYVYSDAQRAMAGRCATSVDGDDPTLLVCTYAATKPQYLGANRIIVSCSYMGETKTYDKPAFTFVRWTGDQEGEEIQIEDPDVDVEISVEDVSSSILQEAIAACIAATEEAREVVDVHRGPQGYSAYEVAVREGFSGTEDEWLESLVGPQGPRGIQGVQGAQGKQGPQGLQGNPGSNQDYPFELVNNEATDDAAKAHTAAGAKRLKDEITRLDADVNGYVGGEDVTPTMAQGHYYTVSGTTINVTTQASSWCSGDASTTPPTGGLDISAYAGKIIKVTATNRTASSTRCCAMLDESNAVVKSWKESEFTADGNKFSWQGVIPSTAKWLFLSGSPSFALESVLVLAEVVVEGLSPKVAALESAMESLVNKRPIGLSGLVPASPYINVTDNTWKTSTTTKSVIVEIQPGHSYRIVSNADLPARYAFLTSLTKGSAGETPAYASGESEVHVLPYGGASVTVTAPIDAVGLYLLGTLEGSNTMPQALYEVTDKVTALQGEIDATKKRTSVYALTLGKRIDLRNPSSANFGKVVAATNNDWGVSQLFEVGDARVIRYYANTISSSSNYGGWTGACFYDAAGNPLTEGYRLIYLGDRSYSQWIDAIVPAGAKYFRVCVGASLNGSADKNVQMFGLKAEDVYEAGKDAAAYNHQYFGEKVRFDNLYSLTIPAASAYAGQSAAIYGKYLFIVSNHLANVVLFDMESKTILYTLATGFVEDGDWHCNQSSFGVHKYEDADMFPLLYISQRNNIEGRGVIQGYRIVPTLTDGEISSFAMSLTQTIYLPAMTDANCLGNPNLTFDAERNRMWAYSRNNDEEADNYNKARFTMFDIPPLYDNGILVSEVVLNDGDILDAFGEDWSMYNAQGGTIRDGKLVILQGYPNAGYIYCRVIDLYAQKRQVSFFDLMADGLDKEPEGVFFYDGAIHFTSASKNIYRINLY